MKYSTIDCKMDYLINALLHSEVGIESHSEQFTQLKGLTRHERSVHGEKKFVCDQCNKSFTRKDDLKRHEGTITHICDKCRKEFYRRDNLVEHQMQCQENPLKRKPDEDDSGPASKKMRDANQVGEGNPCSSTSAFEDSLKKIELKPRKDQKQDMSHFLRPRDCGQEIAELDLTDVANDNEEGYILEVDLQYPKELHDLHNDYPLAPEKMKISSEMLSPYCQDLSECLQPRGGAVSKLIPNLQDKTNYVVHYRNLKHLALGMKLTKIHRVLVIQQSPWLKSYIDFNTEKRKHAANDFEKDFYKLMNNSVFGRTMENLRKRVNVKLVNNKAKLSKLIASPSFDYFRIFSEDLAALNMKKTKLYLNRPIYVGFTILDLSKVLVYQFHYEYMKPKYDCNAKLLFTDTDCLCYEIKIDDVYQDMLQDIHLFDTSEYARDHPLHSNV